jgi:antitoxin (DNA-binding transcriptional repressor) of toxin-antitoxin stability system
MTIEEAQTKLSEVIDKLGPGEEVIITRNEQPVAKLVGQPGDPQLSTTASDVIIDPTNDIEVSPATY